MGKKGSIQPDSTLLKSVSVSTADRMGKKVPAALAESLEFESFSIHCGSNGEKSSELGLNGGRTIVFQYPLRIEWGKKM